jgi:uncharacterized membrane protein
MKKTKLLLLQFLTTLIPAIYLLAIWNSLPESVPLHYNSQMQADRFGSRLELLGVIIFMSLVSLGTSSLILYLNKLDPKQRYQTSNALIIKISWTITVFLTLLSTFIVYQTKSYTETTEHGFTIKIIEALVALLFAALGNFMNNIKPNYFIGFRTPWNLENEDNWKKTHHLGSKLWFFGGLLMFALVLLLPVKYGIYIIIGGVLPITIIPIAYSYLLFKKSLKKI